MKLPVIKNMLSYLEEHEEKDLETAVEVLEHFSMARGLKDEEQEVIGEIISNLFGAIEVKNDMSSGTEMKDALNGFMKRVTGSIDS